MNNNRFRENNTKNERILHEAKITYSAERAKFLDKFWFTCDESHEESTPYIILNVQ